MGKRRDEDEEQGVWVPTAKDVRELEQKLENYKLVKVDGVYRSVEDQYCADMGWCKFEDGALIITEPTNYRITRMTYERMKYKQYFEQERFFKDNPDEEVRYRERIGDLFKNLSDKFRLV